MEIEVVQWACINISTTCYDNLTRNSARSEKKRPTKVKVLPRPKIIWKKKRLNGGKGLLGPWRLHDDYRISAKIGESRNK